MFISVVAILDRQILNLLVDPIRAELALTDIQIGVLQGPAFMVFYTLFGFPLGWMVDRMHRLRLLAAGIALWTAGTIACGLADSYEALIVARAIVGMGEAVASPASISLIADYFRPERRQWQPAFTEPPPCSERAWLWLAGGCCYPSPKS
ncbi:hypothetical protein C7W88_16515 [Novosphingobium sp. THN1]|nr:MFS transporter [Novosphingobium sp. THN1]AXU20291.1 hypothetical protein C7W88_16515 [Novosphingobium sp. THN1]